MRALGLFSLLVFSCLATGCRSPAPTTNASIIGRYTVRGDRWYAFEDITLHGDSFEWQYHTDVIPGPEPIGGKVSLEGCLLTLEHPKMLQPHRILTQRRGIYLMWTPEQYEKHLRTGRTPNDVLYQTR